MAIGWNFGDGHLHNEQLIAALQRRCHFEPGTCGWYCSTHSRCTGRPSVTGLSTRSPGSSRGWVDVADMVVRQPWDDDVPVHVESGTHPLDPVAPRFIDLYRHPGLWPATGYGWVFRLPVLREVLVAAFQIPG